MFFIFFVFAFFYTVLAFPIEEDQRDGIYSILNSTYPAALNASVTKVEPSEISAPDPLPSWPIHCFEPGPTRQKTNVEGCRATLQKFRTFPDWKTKQTFQMHVKPKVPLPPPWGFYQDHTNCVVELWAFPPSVTDKFRWEDVRLLAQNILQDCADRPGFGAGGRSMIGQGVGWEVAVIGSAGPPSNGIFDVSGPSNVSYSMEASSLNETRTY